MPAGIAVALQFQAETRCFTRPDLRELIRQECAENANKAREWGACIKKRDDLRRERDKCAGRVSARNEDLKILRVELDARGLQIDALKIELDGRWKWSTWFVIGAGALLAVEVGVVIAFR